MANAVYPTAITKMMQSLLGTQGFGATPDIRMLLIRTSGTQTGPYYTYNSAHEFLDDIPNNVDCRPEAAVALTSEQVASLAFDAADVTFPSVGVSGDDDIQAVVIYNHTGVEGTSDLIAYYDTSSDATLPVSPNGSNVNILINASGLITAS